MPAAALLCVGIVGWIGSASARADAAVALAIYPPWWSAEQALIAAAAAGNVVSAGRLSFSIAVQSAQPGLPERLRANGAIYVFDANAMSSCSPSEGPDA